MCRSWALLASVHGNTFSLYRALQRSWESRALGPDIVLMSLLYNLWKDKKNVKEKITSPKCTVTDIVLLSSILIGFDFPVFTSVKFHQPTWWKVSSQTEVLTVYIKRKLFHWRHMDSSRCFSSPLNEQYIGT